MTAAINRTITPTMAKVDASRLEIAIPAGLLLVSVSLPGKHETAALLARFPAGSEALVAVCWNGATAQYETFVRVDEPEGNGSMVEFRSQRLPGGAAIAEGINRFADRHFGPTKATPAPKGYDHEEDRRLAQERAQATLDAMPAVEWFSHRAWDRRDTWEIGVAWSKATEYRPELQPYRREIKLQLPRLNWSAFRLSTRGLK